MNFSLKNKSSIDDIRKRFDGDVERFSNLETGQQATVDAPLSMVLITQAAVRTNPDAKNVLDIGCGAGNNSLKLAEHFPNINCDLVDLSQPMLNRAQARLSKTCKGTIRTYREDVRNVNLPDNHYDIIIAAAILHHLRDDSDWEMVFQKIFRLTAPGGSVWITDLVSHEIESVQQMMWDRYGEYLETVGGPEYRKNVFEYIKKEDSPRPVTWQLHLLKRSGFASVDIIHKNSCFAAFGALKAE